MGLLVEGTALNWDDSVEHHAHVKREGVKQFLEIYKNLKDVKGDVLKWGDEVEYTLVNKEADGTFKLACLAPELLEVLMEEEKLSPDTCKILWRPEYSNWQIEGTPGQPYRCYVNDLMLVEQNMRLRRQVIQKLCTDKTHVLSMSSTPILGMPTLLTPAQSFEPPEGATPVSLSNFIPDTAINPHPRFATLTRNIRLRRGSKVDIRVPLYQDDHTPATPEEAGLDASVEHISVPAPSLASGIEMDCMAFGMGASCLQVTAQTRDLDEARNLYDQLGVMAPIMLALTAATPAWRGRLAATDVRWNVICASVDDRTPGERGDGELKEGEQRIPKSRYSSISCFIAKYGECEDTSSCSDRAASSAMDELDELGMDMELGAPEPETDGKESWPATEPEPEAAYRSLRGCEGAAVHSREYDDIPLPLNAEVLTTMLENGVDEALSRHVAHLFLRDPLVIYKEKLDMDAAKCSDHFENIQSTNWNSVRFKPPPPGSPIGWRVEFRTMELNLTDFENAAFSLFIILLSRITIVFKLNLYIPISKVDANMEAAHENDAVTKEKFYFRQHIMSKDVKSVELSHSASPHCREHAVDDKITGEFGCCPTKASRLHDCDLMTINEIINGKACEEHGEKNGEHGFPGLMPLIQAYLDIIGCDGAVRDVINCYMDLVRMRASGELTTTAVWMRNFVKAHKDYKGDSVISESIHNDLMQACVDVSSGKVVPTDLLGTMDKRIAFLTERLKEEGAAGGFGARAAGEAAIPEEPTEARTEAEHKWSEDASARWHDTLGRLVAELPPDARLRGDSLNR